MGFLIDKSKKQTNIKSGVSKDNIAGLSSTSSNIGASILFLDLKWKDATKKEKRKMMISAYDKYAF